MLKARRERSPEIILCLLENGVDFKFQERKWAVAIAVAENHQRLFDATFGWIVDLNDMPVIWGCRTLLQCVAARGDEELVRRFLLRGANVNHGRSFEDWGGNCALIAAAACGHASTVRVLLDSGAKIEGARCQFGDVLQTFCFFGYADILQTLLDMQPAGLDWNVKTSKGADLLSLAAQPFFTQWKWELKKADNARVVKILTTVCRRFDNIMLQEYRLYR